MVCLRDSRRASVRRCSWRRSGGRVIAKADLVLPKKKNPKGLTQGQLVEGLVALSALGGDCLEDLETFQRTRGWKFAVSADMTLQLRQEVEQLGPDDWQMWKVESDGFVRDWAEVPFVPSRKTEKRDLKPYRYLAIRIRPPQGVLFSDGNRVKTFAVVTNDWEMGGQALLEWHRGKAGSVEQTASHLEGRAGCRRLSQWQVRGQRRLAAPAGADAQCADPDEGNGAGRGVSPGPSEAAAFRHLQPSGPGDPACPAHFDAGSRQDSEDDHRTRVGTASSPILVGSLTRNTVLLKSASGHPEGAAFPAAETVTLSARPQPSADHLLPRRPTLRRLALPVPRKAPVAPVSYHSDRQMWGFGASVSLAKHGGMC